MEEASFISNDELNSGSEFQNLQSVMEAKGKKPRSGRKSSSKANEKMEQLENRVNERLDTMMNFLRESIQTLSSSVLENTASHNVHETNVSHNSLADQDTGGLSTRRPEPMVSNVDDSSGMHPIIPLESEVQIEGTLSVPEMDDMISLAPSVREVRELLGDNESSVQEESITAHDFDNNQHKLDSNNNNRFQNLINKSDEHTKTLTDIFGNVSSSEEEKTGLVLDKTQEEILKKSWRITDPERLSAYRDEYRQCFPVHPNSAAFLQVPGLDDILEPMLRKKHGNKTKGWGKSKHLISQPYKSIETLAYQGQMAARMGIISLSYMQQALGTLLDSITCQDADTVQAIKDIFSMSTKALDQMGRAGAFHHLIRRKTAAQDSGLYTLKDIHSKIICLPLSEDGVFGKKLEEKLKERKEQKDSLKDLIPEWNEKNQKRKFSENSAENSGNFKKPRTTTVLNNSYRTATQRPNYSRRSYDYKPREDNSRNTSTSATVDRIGSFRIPKKSNK
ncbi:uncharacterized protein LOC134283032 [Saccostrea cucullata]|uniref:uncharacterized protein LOC134283032 n=1 Tax=Saccostrea cuccullata TaxID=36930 RepID=UPI002ED68275